MRALMLLGPTASGKTALALELARHLPVEIISVDSALVYRDMDIGTAKPKKEIRHLTTSSTSAIRCRATALRNSPPMPGG